MRKRERFRAVTMDIADHRGVVGMCVVLGIMVDAVMISTTSAHIVIGCTFICVWCFRSVGVYILC